MRKHAANGQAGEEAQNNQKNGRHAGKKLAS
jgi:hypothetical protein